MENQKIRIRLTGFDHRLLDHSAKNIVESARRTGAEMVGPIPLPVKISRYTVLRSPHVNKKSREQFEMRVFTRILDIAEPTDQTINRLMKLDLPAGVDVSIVTQQSGAEQAVTSSAAPSSAKKKPVKRPSVNRQAAKPKKSSKKSAKRRAEKGPSVKQKKPAKKS